MERETTTHFAAVAARDVAAAANALTHARLVRTVAAENAARAVRAAQQRAAEAADDQPAGNTDSVIAAESMMTRTTHPRPTSVAISDILLEPAALDAELGIGATAASVENGSNATRTAANTANDSGVTSATVPTRRKTQLYLG